MYKVSIALLYCFSFTIWANTAGLKNIEHQIDPAVKQQINKILNNEYLTTQQRLTLLKKQKHNAVILIGKTLNQKPKFTVPLIQLLDNLGDIKATPYLLTYLTSLKPYNSEENFSEIKTTIAVLANLNSETALTELLKIFATEQTALAIKLSSAAAIVKLRHHSPEQIEFIYHVATKRIDYIKQYQLHITNRDIDQALISIDNSKSLALLLPSFHQGMAYNAIPLLDYLVEKDTPEVVAAIKKVVFNNKDYEAHHMISALNALTHLTHNLPIATIVERYDFYIKASHNDIKYVKRIQKLKSELLEKGKISKQNIIF